MAKNAMKIENVGSFGWKLFNVLYALVKWWYSSHIQIGTLKYFALFHVQVEMQ